MKKLALATAVIIFLFPAAVYPQKEKGFLKHFNGSLFSIGEKGLYSVEVITDDKEYKKLGKGTLGLVVHGSNDEDVEGAQITITVIEKGAPVPVRASIKEKGQGLYTVEGLGIERDGIWELRVKVRKGKSEDEAVFAFPEAVKELKPTGRHGS